MPPVDAGNQDTVLTCTNNLCWVAFGTGAVVSGSGGAVGSITVTPGTPILLTTNATTLAAAQAKGNPNVIGGTPASVAAGAVAFAAIARMRGVSLTVTRGSTAASNVF